MNYLIVDDEPIAHRIIEGYCEELSHLNKVGNAYNALEAAVIVKVQKIDLIFLDINMPKISGYEWLKTLQNPPKIIVTSAYQQYALEGYELDIVDYLLKPFSLARFLKAINKIEVNKPTNHLNHKTNLELEDNRFFVKGDKMHHQINTNDILYIEAFGNYCKLHLKEKVILTHQKISILEGILSIKKFLRIHKSFIVAIENIDAVQGNQIHVQNAKIPIGQTYKSRVNELLGNNF